MTIEDRGAIQAMKKLGHSNRAIGSPTTISNELKRGTPPRTGSRGRAPGYSAKRGDAVYKENRKNSKPGRPEKVDSVYVRNGVADVCMISEPLADRRKTVVTQTRAALDFADEPPSSGEATARFGKLEATDLYMDDQA